MGGRINPPVLAYCELAEPLKDWTEMKNYSMPNCQQHETYDISC